MNWDTVQKPIATGLKNFTNAKCVSNKLVNPKTVTTCGLVAFSIIAKDAVNCLFYTWQSLNNKEIPERDRGFVASLDLANGFVNVVGQLLIVKPVERITGQWFDKLFTKEGIFSTDCLKNLSKNERMMCKKGFKTLATLAICQIFAKRVITPLFATPAAKSIVNFAKRNRREREERNSALAAKSSDVVQISQNKDTGKNANVADNVTKTAAVTEVSKKPEITVVKDKLPTNNNNVKKNKPEITVVKDKLPATKAKEQTVKDNKSETVASETKINDKADNTTEKKIKKSSKEQAA